MDTADKKFTGALRALCDKYTSEPIDLNPTRTQCSQNCGSCPEGRCTKFYGYPVLEVRHG